MGSACMTSHAWIDREFAADAAPFAPEARVRRRPSQKQKQRRLN